ncbi:hypothetical protein L218DRAFT_952503 [Marasmius fiardii PR-910]|nr:hypothetical protein L218DRAFT_952503 [Marasmius fiardii PR-910]
MSSLRPSHRRRRSQSAATSPSNHRISESSSLGFVQRARPHSSYIHDFSSPCKRDPEVWKAKRRRRELSCSGISSDDDILEDDQEMSSNTRMIFGSRAPTPAFAATSAEFHLFPSPNGRARHASHNSSSFHSHDTPTITELNSLRSNAFWELQRSVMENGEGLVRRMRDYERTRSRAETYTKVKDAQKRGKKRSSLITFGRRAPSPLLDESEGDDEDDIQIYSGEVPQPFSRREVRHKTSSGSDTLMDAWSAPSERCSSPCSSSYMTDEEHLTAPDNDIQNNRQQDLRTHFPHLPSSYSVSEALGGSSPSPFTSFSSSVGSKRTTHATSANSSRSEKAIAALTLALASGSAGINDYEALRNLQPVLALDDGQVGEMWH